MADQRSTESRDDFSERHLVKDRSSEKPRKGDAEAAKGNGSTEATFRDSDAVSNDSSIKENTLTWPQAAGLMLSEYIVIAILSFPSSYAVLGMAGGVIATLGIGLCVLYTSHVLWRFCLANPHIKDIVEISRQIFGGSRIVYELTMIAFLLNNIFITGLHVLSGAIALNTITDHAFCTIGFTAIITVLMFAMSLVRELRAVSILGFIAAGTMFIAFLLTLIFLGVEPGPAGWSPGQPITIRAFAAPGTTFAAGFNAFLNITYTFVGQILVPTYVGDMARPQDFGKALYLCTVCEILVFTLGGAVGYYYIGDEWITSPAYGSLDRLYAKIVAGFTLPTVIVVGVLYSNITARFIFFRFFKPESVHRRQHTVKGWAIWTAIVAIVWLISYCIGEGIPFFSELLSLMSSLFDWYFGFVLEAVCFFRLYNQQQRSANGWRKAETVANILIGIAGLFILVGGCYSSIQAIKDDYAAGTVAGAFTCESNGF